MNADLHTNNQKTKLMKTSNSQEKHCLCDEDINEDSNDNYNEKHLYQTQRLTEIYKQRKQMELGATTQGEKQKYNTALNSIDTGIELNKHASKHSLEMENKTDTDTAIRYKVRPSRPATAGR